jgi:SHS2 domain-containing protein
MVEIIRNREWLTSGLTYTGMMDKTAGFEELEHTADWSLRIWGGSMAELLEAGAKGLMSLMGVRTRPDGRSVRHVELHSSDREGLLVVWLEDVLFALESRAVAPARLSITAADTWLQADLEEAPAGPAEKPIKAVTYHRLKVEATATGLEAILVVDV